MKSKLARLLDSRNFYLIFSILLALLYWLVLSLADDSDVEQVLYDVPVQLDYNASVYQGFGLEIIGDEPVMVDVTVVGPRSVVQSLTADDILVYPNVNAVTTAGVRTLRLSYATVNGTAPYTITQLSQETVTLRFDSIVTQRFTVRADSNVIEVADGYLLGTLTANPTEITVTGPSQEVSAIAGAQVSMPDIAEAGRLSATQVTQGMVQLLNADGEEVDRTFLTLDSETVEMTVPVLRRVEMGLRLQFLNTPQSFNPDTLGAVMDHDTIVVAMPTEIETDEELTLYLDFNQFDYLGENVIPINLPENYVKIENIDAVTVQCNTANYATKLVTVTNMRVVNQSAGRTVRVDTQRIYNVELVGPADIIELLDALEREDRLDEAVIAQVNADNIRTNSGQQLVEVQIVLPSFNSVFALGSYQVVAVVE